MRVLLLVATVHSAQRVFLNFILGLVRFST